MSNTAAPPSSPPPTTPLGVDLDAVERGMRAATGTDLTEAKEAVVEALLRLAVQKCTGEGSKGEFIFGVKPSAKLVSGFLLPRFDATGQGDETSDIRIATMGIDLQVAAERFGEIVVIPDLAIYVRMLPTWEDLSDPRHDMAPRSELSRETRQTVEDRARQIINEAIAALPPVEEVSEPDERPGEAVAEAQRARDVADQVEQRIAEEGQPDADARGHNRAAQAAAARAEEIATARRKGAQDRLAARRQRNTAVAVIRREAFNGAFAELGIRLRETRTGATNLRAVTADDLAIDLGSEESQAGSPAVLDDVHPQDTNAGAAAEGTPAEVAAGADIAVRPGAGILDDQIAEPQPIPMKWRRFRLDLGEFRFDCHDAASRDATTAAFTTRVLQQARVVLEAWIGSPEGQRDAYRPKERILPSNFASKTGWERYLDSLR